MIACFSCSSPVSSVAILSEDGDVLFSAEEETSQNASGASIGMLNAGLRSMDLCLREFRLFLADLGPGSFIGVRVGVTLAKTFAFAQGGLAGGTSSFDLIDAGSNVALPSKRGEYFLRRMGQGPLRTEDLPQDEKIIGYGPAFDIQTYPKAERFSSLLWKITPIKAELLLPEYLIEPSISVPKRAYAVKQS